MEWPSFLQKCEALSLTFESNSADYLILIFQNCCSTNLRGRRRLAGWLSLASADGFPRTTVTVFGRGTERVHLWSCHYRWVLPPLFFSIPLLLDPSNPEENAFIRIKEEALKIPSLWDSTLLLLELDKNTSWWDQSRRYVLQATVTVSQEDFAEACIGHGPFATRYVFVVPADVGQGTTSLSKKYQAGNQVHFIRFALLFPDF